MSKATALKRLNYATKCLHEAKRELDGISRDDCTERTRKCIDSTLYEIECAIKWMGHIDMADYGLSRVGENIVTGTRQQTKENRNEDRSR